MWVSGSREGDCVILAVHAPCEEPRASSGLDSRKQVSRCRCRALSYHQERGGVAHAVSNCRNRRSLEPHPPRPEQPDRRGSGRQLDIDIHLRFHPTPNLHGVVRAKIEGAHAQFVFGQPGHLDARTRSEADPPRYAAGRDEHQRRGNWQ